MTTHTEPTYRDTRVLHRPLHTRHGTECVCGMFCGSARGSWQSHANDQLTLYPNLVVFDFTPTTLEREALRKAAERAGDAFAAFKRALIPMTDTLRKLNRDGVTRA